MKPVFVESSVRILTTITDRERIFRWGRTHPSHDPFSRQKWDQSWQCRRSVDCIMATNDGPPEEARNLPRYLTSPFEVSGRSAPCAGGNLPFSHTPD